MIKCECQRCASIAVRNINRRSAFDEESHGRVARAPGCNLKSHAVLRDTEIAVAV